jgi:succinate dehydrogenase/fumarate reductase iron-sulfur protein
MTGNESITIELYRWDPSEGSEARFEQFKVPKVRGMRIMDALEHIYSSQSETFAYRWFCGTKRCGMCAVSVNGKPRLAFWEPAEARMRIEPLAHFPIVRDLVVDFEANERALTALRPVVTGERSPTFPVDLDHVEMEKHFALMDCIDCRICVAACTVLDDPGAGRFVGPYALVQLAKAALHPRNDSDLTSSIMGSGIELCLSCNACTEACPSGIPILTGAIDELRDKLVQSGDYPIHFWWMIRRMPASLRRLLRCVLWGRVTKFRTAIQRGRTSL